MHDDRNDEGPSGSRPAEDAPPPEAGGVVARAPDAILPAFSPDVFTFGPETPWMQVAALYLADLNSENTWRSYERHLRGAFGLLGVATLHGLTLPMLAAYRAYVLRQPLAPSSQALALAALRSFLTWAADYDAHGLPVEKLKRALRSPKRTPRPARDLPTDADIAKVLSQPLSRRDRAVMMTFLGAGLRISELVSLNVSDLHRARESQGLYLHVRNGKGNKDRHVPVQEDVERALLDYLADTGRSVGNPGPLFRAYDSVHKSRKPHTASAPRRRFSARGCVYRLVKRILERAGLDPRLSPHSLRHTYALLVYRASRDVLAAQKLLGHASLATTQVYLDHLSVDELRLRCRRCRPRHLPAWMKGDSPRARHRRSPAVAASEASESAEAARRAAGGSPAPPG